MNVNCFPLGGSSSNLIRFTVVFPQLLLLIRRVFNHLKLNQNDVIHCHRHNKLRMFEKLQKWNKDLLFVDFFHLPNS